MISINAERITVSINAIAADDGLSEKAFFREP
jgi:hypothetical protein